MMPARKDIRFFPIFIGATMGVLLEVIATLVDEIVVGNLFSDEAFASVNLIEQYIQLKCLSRILSLWPRLRLSCGRTVPATGKEWVSFSARQSSYADCPERG